MTFLGSVARALIPLFAAGACAQFRSFRVDLERANPLPASRANTPRAAPPKSTVFAGDAVVRIVVGRVTCSGTLIDTNRVLTAHHCVAQRTRLGEMLGVDVPPDQVTIELGGDYLPWGEVGVRAIVAPPCGYRTGRGDIAILVLERPLTGVPVLRPRLDQAPSVGESVQPLGFGRCDMSPDGIRRRQRPSTNIENTEDGSFRLDAAICPGDSGGPAVSADREILGVVSASVMDGNEDTLGFTEFTRVDYWRPLFAQSQLIADGSSPLELPPLSCPD